MNRPPDTFTTARLFARRPRLDDAPAIFNAYAADAEVTRYLTWKPHANVESVAEYLKASIAQWETEPNFRYELCLQGRDCPMGSIELRQEETSVSFGYLLEKSMWGRGLIAEALKFAVAWALAQPVVIRAYAFCDVENPNSVRVMEKAGMIRAGILHWRHVCPNIASVPRDCILCEKVPT